MPERLLHDDRFAIANWLNQAVFAAVPEVKAAIIHSALASIDLNNLSRESVTGALSSALDAYHTEMRASAIEKAQEL